MDKGKRGQNRGLGRDRENSPLLATKSAKEQNNQELVYLSAIVAAGLATKYFPIPALDRKKEIAVSAIAIAKEIYKQVHTDASRES